MQDVAELVHRGLKSTFSKASDRGASVAALRCLAAAFGTKEPSPALLGLLDSPDPDNSKRLQLVPDLISLAQGDDRRKHVSEKPLATHIYHESLSHLQGPIQRPHEAINDVLDAKLRKVTIELKVESNCCFVQTLDVSGHC